MRKKIRLRMENPDGLLSENELEILDNDIIVCFVPRDFGPENADKLKQIFVKAFTQEGPNLVIVPYAVDIKIMRAVDENAKG